MRKYVLYGFVIANSFLAGACLATGSVYPPIVSLAAIVMCSIALSQYVKE